MTQKYKTVSGPMANYRNVAMYNYGVIKEVNALDSSAPKLISSELLFFSSNLSTSGFISFHTFIY